MGIGVYDTLMLVMLAAATFIGWRKGMVSQVAAIVSLTASFFVAWNFHVPVAAKINAVDPLNRIAAFVLLYLGTSLVVWFFSKSIRSSLERMKLREFDHQMGGLLGVGKGIALVCAATLVSANLFVDLIPELGPSIVNSRSGELVSKFVHMMPSGVQPYLAQYVGRLDDLLGRGSEWSPDMTPSGGLENRGTPFERSEGYSSSTPIPPPRMPPRESRERYLPPDSSSSSWPNFTERWRGGEESDRRY